MRAGAGRRRRDINLADPENITPLLMAVLNARFDTAKVLIEAGADVNRWDIWGRAPLYSAIDFNTTPRGGRPDRPSSDDHDGAGRRAACCWSVVRTRTCS